MWGNFMKSLGAKTEKRMTVNDLNKYTWNNTSFILPNKPDLLKEQTYIKCIQFHANKMASIPLKVYKRDKNNSITEAIDHKLWNTLRYMPNNYTNITDLIKALYTLAGQDGQAGLYIKRDDMTLHVAKINSYLILDADLINSVKNHPLLVNITVGNAEAYCFAEDLIIVRDGITFDGVEGISINKYIEDDVLNVKAGSDYLAKLFANGMVNDKIAISMASDIKDEKEIKKIQSKFDRLYSANENIFTFPMGASLNVISSKLVDTEFSVLRSMSKKSIGNAFGLYPSQIGLTDTAPTEEENLRFLQDTLHPLIMALECEFNNKYMPIEDKKQGYFIGLDINELLRTTPKTQQEIICEYTKQGIYSLNQAKSRANVPLLEKDVTLFPSGQITLESLINGEASYIDKTKNSSEKVGDKNG